MFFIFWSHDHVLIHVYFVFLILIFLFLFLLIVIFFIFLSFLLFSLISFATGISLSSLFVWLLRLIERIWIQVLIAMLKLWQMLLLDSFFILFTLFSSLFSSFSFWSLDVLVVGLVRGIWRALSWILVVEWTLRLVIDWLFWAGLFMTFFSFFGTFFLGFTCGPGVFPLFLLSLFIFNINPFLCKLLILDPTSLQRQSLLFLLLPYPNFLRITLIQILNPLHLPNPTITLNIAQCHTINSLHNLPLSTDPLPLPLLTYPLILPSLPLILLFLFV